MTKRLEIETREGANGGKKHHFAVQQPTRGRGGENQDSLLGRPRAQAGRFRRPIGWFRKTASRVWILGS